MSDKDQAKIEKKRKKAEYKLEKKRSKEELRSPEVLSPESKNQQPNDQEPVEEAGGERPKIDEESNRMPPERSDRPYSCIVKKRMAKEPTHKDPGKTTIKVILPKEKPAVWYKNPSWIRAIASVVVMIVVILTFYLTYR